MDMDGVVVGVGGRWEMDWVWTAAKMADLELKLSMTMLASESHYAGLGSRFSSLSRQKDSG